jgi:hypothetical protein
MGDGSVAKLVISAPSHCIQMGDRLTSFLSEERRVVSGGSAEEWENGWGVSSGASVDAGAGGTYPRRDGTHTAPTVSSGAGAGAGGAYPRRDGTHTAPAVSTIAIAGPSSPEGTDTPGTEHALHDRCTLHDTVLDTVVYPALATLYCSALHSATEHYVVVCCSPELH